MTTSIDTGTESKLQSKTYSSTELGVGRREFVQSSSKSRYSLKDCIFI